MDDLFFRDESQGTGADELIADGQVGVMLFAEVLDFLQQCCLGLAGLFFSSAVIWNVNLVMAFPLRTVTCVRALRASSSPVAGP